VRIIIIVALLWIHVTLVHELVVIGTSSIVYKLPCWSIVGLDKVFSYRTNYVL
jgi:hypothetical protein